MTSPAFWLDEGAESLAAWQESTSLGMMEAGSGAGLEMVAEEDGSVNFIPLVFSAVNAESCKVEARTHSSIRDFNPH